MNHGTQNYTCSVQHGKYIGMHRGTWCGTADAAGLSQMLVVDVLTGKAKEMQADSSLRNPPKIEDESIGAYVFFPANSSFVLTLCLNSSCALMQGNIRRHW